MEWFWDAAVLLVVSVVLFALFGDLAKRIGLKPFALWLLAGVRILTDVLWVGLIWFGYGLILGRPHWRAQLGYVETTDEDAPDPLPLPLSQPILKTAQYPIATPQTARNEPVVIAPPINELTEVDRVVVEALARLIADGELTQTAAIKVGLGIPPGSRSPRYQAARAAIQAELARLAPLPEPHPPIKVNGDRLMEWSEPA